MAISDEKIAQILRYYHVEKWRVGTISRHLHVHHETVSRVLCQQGVQAKILHQQKSMLDEYMPFIMNVLKKYPTLTSSRLYHMVRERGYPGGVDHFRHMMARHRPKSTPEAYLRLKTLPGEVGQVDWASFQKLTIGRAKRPLMAFVMVLSYSRKIFLQFYLSQSLANFLRGHEAAFAAFGGVPRVLLYDNLKAAVLERKADAIRFQPTFLDFSAHYRFEPRPVAVARGNEKGRVERAIRYIRSNFFAARSWRDIADLNAQAIKWCEGIAADRLCPEDRVKTVREAFLEEQPMLLTLPDNPYPQVERKAVTVGKTPYVRFDLNDYSVPYQYVRHALTVVATLDTVEILDGAICIAKHLRSFDKGQQIETEAHIQELVEWKHKSRHHRGQDRLSQAAPSSYTFLQQSLDRGYTLKSVTKQLLILLGEYGAQELEIALQEALARNAAHPNTVQLILTQRREAQQAPPPLPLRLTEHPKLQNIIIKPHSLSNYDELPTNGDEEHDK